MNPKTYIFILLAFILGCNNPSPAPTTDKTPESKETPSAEPTKPLTIVDQAQQLIVVTSPTNSQLTGKLYRFEKQNNQWEAKSNVHPITLGKNGLAWGLGKHDPKDGLQKKEGDKKSPAGIFTFGTAFGYAKKDDAPAFKLPYVQITEVTQCIEDSKSKYYNQIIDNSTVTKDWDAADFMKRDDDLYKWGVFVHHNTEQKAEGGSCIFLHLWRASDKPTAGCTAMTEENILSLLQWLDPSKQPILVQMQESDYSLFKEKYNLPKL